MLNLVTCELDLFLCIPIFVFFFFTFAGSSFHVTPLLVGLTPFLSPLSLSSLYRIIILSMCFMPLCIRRGGVGLISQLMNIVVCVIQEWLTTTLHFQGLYFFLISKIFLFLVFIYIHCNIDRYLNYFFGVILQKRQLHYTQGIL